MTVYTVIRYSRILDAAATGDERGRTRVIVSFRDQGTEDVFHGRNTKAARSTCPRQIWSVAQRKLDYLKNADDLSDLRVPPGNRLERLKGERRGQHSIRVNRQYRICFRWTEHGAAEVEIDDYHD